MHTSCAARGAGSAQSAADYLVGERDSAGRVRLCIEVVRGNPDHVATFADSLGFEHKYTSLVIAWVPEDRPTDAQFDTVLDEFEKSACAGLEPDRYAWKAVLHREHGDGVHPHVLGRRLLPASQRVFNSAGCNLAAHSSTASARSRDSQYSRRQFGDGGSSRYGGPSAGWYNRLPEGEETEWRAE